MYILLTLFFISLIGIIVMLSRKILALEGKQTIEKEKAFLRTEYLEEIKHLTIKNARKHGYNVLVLLIRFYVKSINFLKNKYGIIKTELKEIYEKKFKKKNGDQKKEASKFLKVISEYKHKIREIKHKIKEEEESL